VALAVADHVAGRAGMGLLSRILYVADQAAADRSFAGVEELRGLMRVSLEQAVLQVARNKLLAVVHRGWLVEPQTVALYNELIAGGTASAG
jgi:HD superfamily phosphohydrolase YqeK